MIRTHPTLPLFIAAGTTWCGAGQWLTEWLSHPGTLADALVFQAFAANFAVLFTLWALVLYRRTGGDA